MNGPTNGLTFEVLAHGHDGESLLPLFETVFGVRLSLEHWLWKYKDERSFHVVCRASDGMPIGHAAVQYAGHTPSGALVGQVGDVMVHPVFRGQLTAGVFAQMLDRLASEAVSRGFELCYGFPGERPARLGLRLGIYEEVGRPLEVLVPHRDDGWSKLLNCWRRPVRELLGLTELARLIRCTPISGRLGRGADFLQWRYLASPEQYRVFLVGRRLTGQALAVCRNRADGSLLVVAWLAGETKAQLACLRALADAVGTNVFVWKQLLPFDHGLGACQTPFVTIRLARVGQADIAADWFEHCQPGDVDVY